MGVIELSAIYGLVSSFFRNSMSMTVAAILFAVTCIVGAILSPLDMGTTVKMLVFAWMAFNLSLFSCIFVPLLRYQRSEQT